MCQAFSAIPPATTLQDMYRTLFHEHRGAAICFFCLRLPAARPDLVNARRYVSRTVHVVCACLCLW